MVAAGHIVNAVGVVSQDTTSRSEYKHGVRKHLMIKWYANITNHWSCIYSPSLETSHWRLHKLSVQALDMSDASTLASHWGTSRCRPLETRASGVMFGAPLDTSSAF
jgi:hypothetical protein